MSNYFYEELQRRFDFRIIHKFSEGHSQTVLLIERNDVPQILKILGLKTDIEKFPDFEFVIPDAILRYYRQLKDCGVRIPIAEPYTEFTIIQRKNVLLNWHTYAGESLQEELMHSPKRKAEDLIAKVFVECSKALEGGLGFSGYPTQFCVEDGDISFIDFYVPVLRDRISYFKKGKDKELSYFLTHFVPIVLIRRTIEDYQKVRPDMNERIKGLAADIFGREYPQETKLVLEQITEADYLFGNTWIETHPNAKRWFVLRNNRCITESSNLISFREDELKGSCLVYPSEINNKLLFGEEVIEGKKEYIGDLDDKHS